MYLLFTAGVGETKLSTWPPCLSLTVTGHGGLSSKVADVILPVLYSLAGVAGTLSAGGDHLHDALIGSPTT